MKIKGLTDEDFVNYKVPSMYIATATCSFKCDNEYGQPICQNSELMKQPTHNVNNQDIVNRYQSNSITKAIVFGGLEPFDDFVCLVELITLFRIRMINDDVVIYTGYNRSEIEDKINIIKDLPNIIIKFGRFIPNQQPHFDETLGVYLSSDNQYAERIS